MNIQVTREMTHYISAATYRKVYEIEFSDAGLVHSLVIKGCQIDRAGILDALWGDTHADYRRYIIHPGSIAFHRHDLSPQVLQELLSAHRRLNSQEFERCLELLRKRPKFHSAT